MKRNTFAAICISLLSISAWSEPLNVDLKGWIGSQSSTIEIAGDIDGLELYRTTQESCDISNYLVCENVNFDILSGNSNTINDQFLTRDSEVFYNLKAHSSTITVPVNAVGNGRIDSNIGRYFIEFKGSLYAVGGYQDVVPSDIYDKFSGGVYRSTDGVKWDAIDDLNIHPYKRQKFNPFVIGDKLYILETYSNPYREKSFANGNCDNLILMSTIDGLDWNTDDVVVDNIACKFSYIINSNVEVFGLITTDSGVEVWSSVDGINWAYRESLALNISSFNQPAITVGSNLYVAGKALGNSTQVVIASLSSNGSFQNYDFDILLDQSSEISINYYENSFILLVSDNLGANFTIYESDDLSSWDEISYNTGLEARVGYTTAVFDNKFWLYGGAYIEKSFDQYISVGETVVSTLDLLKWESKQKSGFTFDGYNSDILYYNDQYWYIGHKSGVWVSDDAISWDQISVTSPRDESEFGVMLNFNDELWYFSSIVVEYVDGVAVYNMPVWSTNDGINWIKKSNKSEMSGLYNQSFTVFDNAIWTLKGSYLFKSTNGVDWDRITQVSGMSNVSGAKLVAFKNRMWIIAGQNIYASFGGVNYNKIYYSYTGKYWYKTWGSPDFPAREFPTVFSDGDKLYLIGGCDIVLEGGCAMSDVWVSANGSSWSEITDTSSLKYNAYNRSLYVNGKLLSMFDNGFGMPIQATKDYINWSIPYYQSVVID